MASITEYLNRLQDLTSRNLEILQALNDSFFTKQNHLSVNVSGATYAIPSFISLENKINYLQENFNNLINAPMTGEAYFNMNGNSRSIEVRGYEHTPNSLVINTVNTFDVETTDIFKDFLYPNTYINFNLSNIPNDITQVNVKKISPLSDKAKALFKELIGENTSININYSDLYKKLYPYKEDTDYSDYNKVYNLPIRKNIGSATYVIESIESDVITDDLENLITLKLRSNLDETIYTNKLTYKRFDETIEISLKVGDYLTTYDHSGKMEIVELRPSTNTIIVKVVNGEYLNLVGAGESEEISDNNKLRFFSPIDFDSDKYVNVSLEEDQYVFIAIAPLNSRMNVQSSWGTGVLINTHKLIYNGDKGEGGKTFNEYYNENIRNIGDILYQISAMSSNTLSKYSKDEFDKIINDIPIINENDLVVVQINTHLNNSSTIKNIRSLYSQKKQYNTELNEIQSKIDDINKQLSSITFDDTSNLRSTYTAQLTEYNSKKVELTNSIIKVVDEIAIAANNSEVPIENAKYRIRGFFDVTKFISDTSLVKGIRVQYRYKNIEQEQGTALSIGEEGKFIFSDWNNMNGFDKVVKPSHDGINYNYKIEGENTNINEPSYNQIDIPISQGETVDIRLKIIYNLGSPFVEVSSQWSPILNIKFPEEYLKDVQILDIITENNNDIETNRFNNILIEEGVPTHLNDKIIDQDITYFHKPENISSGFYTEERRIIPLKDKLSEMNATLTALNDMIKGSSSDSLSVSIVNGEVTNDLQPYQTNNISVSPYDSFIKIGEDEYGYPVYESTADGSYDINSKNGVISTVLNIVLTNTSENTVNLYSLFPGSRDTDIHSLIHTKFDKNDYCKGIDKGVWIGIQSENNEFNIQSANQYIGFRINNPYTGQMYYEDGDQFNKNDLITLNKDVRLSNKEVTKTSATLYPCIKNRFSLCMDSDIINTYITINPKEKIIIPLIFEYKIVGEEYISKTISFDMRISLYKDPINYTVKVTAKYTATPQDKLLTTNRKAKNNYEYHSTVIK